VGSPKASRQEGQRSRWKGLLGSQGVGFGDGVRTLAGHGAAWHRSVPVATEHQGWARWEVRL